MGPPLRTALALGLLVAALPACSVGVGAAGTSGVVQVVAAENVWGSIAKQLGGSHVEVTSIVTNPNADPHDYEPTVADARAMAGGQLVIVNGIGYDPWAQKLLAANPVRGRAVLDVGNLVGVPAGGNPHQWYSPASVQRVIGAITSDYTKLDAKDAGYFAARRSAFGTTGLREYRQLIATIRSRYAGTPVGASESVFTPLARALGLDLVTPASFLTDVSEGVEPTAADKTTIDRQIQTRRIAVYVYNRQNATPDVQRQIDEARAAGIPVTTITETLVPEHATFQSWQAAQLRALLTALAMGAGR